MRFFFLLGWLAVLAHPVLAHPVHETVAEIEWNAGSGRLEVALRLDADDERWIREAMDADVDAVVSDWALPYLKKRLRITNVPQSALPAEASIPKRDPTTYHWIGRDREGPYVWWYFEIAPADGTRPDGIDHNVLYDREPDFLHRVLILGKTPPDAINVTAEQTRIRFADAVKSTEESSPTAAAEDFDENNAPLPPSK
jgi:hypothetical protein